MTQRNNILVIAFVKKPADSISNLPDLFWGTIYSVAYVGIPRPKTIAKQQS